jgi:hypothetical protein
VAGEGVSQTGYRKVADSFMTHKDHVSSLHLSERDGYASLAERFNDSMGIEQTRSEFSRFHHDVHILMENH